MGIDSFIRKLAVLSFLPYAFIIPPILKIENSSFLERKTEETTTESTLLSKKDNSDFTSENNNFFFNEIDYYSYYLSKNEGLSLKVYDPLPNDHKYEPTIGIGHNMKRKDSRAVFKRALPHVNYDDVLLGKRSLTNEEAKKIFEEDIKIYLERTRKIFPKFDIYPIYVRAALLDGVYRGDLSGSPKTIQLINNGDFESAGKEYLNNDEYKKALKKGRKGIRTRMERNSQLMIMYGTFLKKYS